MSKAGLFSAIVAVLLTECYQILSSDSGDQTVVLLLSSSTSPLVNPSDAEHALELPASIVRVNALWFLALVLILSRSLLEMPMQL